MEKTVSGIGILIIGIVFGYMIALDKKPSEGSIEIVTIEPLTITGVGASSLGEPMGQGSCGG